MISTELKDAIIERYTASELVELLDIDTDELFYYIEEIIERSLCLLQDDFPELIAADD